jgi:L-seryl-tRNA(Ser) seleniumtransferase
MSESEFRRLPGVDKVLSEERISLLLDLYPHDLLVDLVRKQLEQSRSMIISGKTCPSLDEIVSSIVAKVNSYQQPNLRPVINATGVLLHTNLGRAPMSQEALEAMVIASRGYSNLEFNLDTGVRGSRLVHIEELLCQLSGAEAALVVNNNAAGVMLGLTAVAKRKEVIVSRGQAVQIGGGFRIPDVMKQSGAKLVEVGTTNFTYDYDYEQAINPRTAALLRVHSSNFKIMGFTSNITLEEMVAVGNNHNIPVLDDLGSGCLLDTAAYGLDHEPMMQESVSQGVALTFCSGDKLIGGPQAGIIVGEKYLIDKLKKHSLYRALRPDKLRLAGLAATLLHYLKGEATEKIPVWRMVTTPLDELERRAHIWAKSIDGIASVVDGESVLGGGSLPGSTLPTKVVAIAGQGKGKNKNAVHLMGKKLRLNSPPIIGRISDDILFLDPRSVLPEDDEIVIRALSMLES